LRGTTLKSNIVDAVEGVPAAMADRIEHVVIIVKENHTFDNYFGTFPGAKRRDVGTRAESAAG
jgi:phospholipase C